MTQTVERTTPAAWPRFRGGVYQRSEVNARVALPAKGAVPALKLGPLRIWPPVVLAPMAGVTNWPFRGLCRAFGAGLYVSEMVTARPLAEGREKTLRLADFGAGEAPRSLQLYGVDPHYVSEAVKRLVGEGRIDHLDMNFGCPVPKVTRKGGGSVIPARPRLLRAIVRAAVRAAGSVPVTIKFRMGIDEARMTFLEAGRIAEDEGCAGVALHARTAAQLYAGEARWDAIAELKAHVRSIPVLGNGDIWEAHDALRMLAQTGCDGVVVGRGCLGRPWLFRELCDVFAGREPDALPNFGEVSAVMQEHARCLASWLGEAPAMRDFRRHTTWYTKAFRGSSRLRAELTRINTLDELKRILDSAEQTEPFPLSALRVGRGKDGGMQKVALPADFDQASYRDSLSLDAEADAMHSGG